MADVEVEVAVAVEVGPGRGGRPVAVAAESRRLGDVFEGAVASIMIEGVRPPPGDEHVGTAVVVVVADGDAVAVAREIRRCRRLGDVLEGPIAPIAEESIAACRRVGGRRERPPLDSVNVEPAIAVVIEESHPRRSSSPAIA